MTKKSSSGILRTYLADLCINAIDMNKKNFPAVHETFELVAERYLLPSLPDGEVERLNFLYGYITYMRSLVNMAHFHHNPYYGHPAEIPESVYCALIGQGYFDTPGKWQHDELHEARRLHSHADEITPEAPETLADADNDARFLYLVQMLDGLTLSFGILQSQGRDLPAAAMHNCLDNALYAAKWRFDPATPLTDAITAAAPRVIAYFRTLGLRPEQAPSIR
ncbi:MAG: hypothetical protein H6865_06505 [Rhodospirillales bacterium]|nr:hypothetical protein [Alphaproteobacteria bacterium]MCB9987272.1 hypothetical protein [Rhodospirillales bacterium]USO07871.1 MAG: hypothetical protein H6866_01195 [Rhodospirillales bacterium]